MKPAARNFTHLIPLPAAVRLALVMTMALSFVRAAQAAAPAPAPTTAPARSVVRDLLALGNEDRFWSADVIPFIQGKASGTKTFFRVRGPGDPQWRLVAELEAPAVALANRGRELLVVLEGGDWRILSEDGGPRSGTPLPGGAHVLALAGDGDDIWAIGAAPAGRTIAPPPSATTRAASTSSSVTTTTASSISTLATTAPASRTLGLFLLHRGDWTLRDDLPPGLERDDLDTVSLAVIDRRLLLAVIDREGAVRVFHRAGDGRWQGGQDIAVAPQPEPRIRLLDLRGRPALWVSDPTGPGVLYVLEDRWSDPIQLQPSPKLVNFDRTALATALGQLRLLASDGKQRLAEQNYNADGTLAGVAVEAVTAPTPMDNRTAQLIQMFVVAVVLMWMMTALRQRPATQEAVRRIDQLNLAPVGRRALGGIIDLLPIVVGLLVAAKIAPPPASATGSPEAVYTSPQFAWFAAGIALYLLHTTATELIFARSIGKFLTGTRVAALDGTRPNALALLTRNFLRIVDVVLLFPPLFVFFSPLRQRVGDMAAGTLVVLNGVEGAPEAPASDSNTPPPPPPSAD